MLATAAERAFSRAPRGQLPHADRRLRAVPRATTSCGCAACSRAATARDVIRGERAATVTDAAGAEALGVALAEEFLARGAARLAAG